MSAWSSRAVPRVSSTISHEVYHHRGRALAVAGSRGAQSLRRPTRASAASACDGDTCGLRHCPCPPPPASERATTRTRRESPPHAPAAAEARRHGQRRAPPAKTSTPLQAATVAHLVTIARGPRHEPAARGQANCSSCATTSPHRARPHAAPGSARQTGLTGRLTSLVLTRYR